MSTIPVRFDSPSPVPSAFPATPRRSSPRPIIPITPGPHSLVLAPGALLPTPRRQTPTLSERSRRLEERYPDRVRYRRLSKSRRCEQCRRRRGPCIIDTESQTVRLVSRFLSLLHCHFFVEARVDSRI